MASKNADPLIGKPGEFEVVDEEQVEVTCDRDRVKQVIAALRKVHPYEEPIIEITPLLSERDL